MFSSVLIANRGEIAVRVIRTARRMDVRTVAVYSDADVNALHVRMADQAVRIGFAPVAESYLRADAIIAAAKQTGAEAIHPGYGFLSENAEFAEACAAAGIVFVGPPASAIRAMGLKDRAKALMAKAGVAVVPGYLGDDQSAKHLAAEAEKIGYPVLIKAVAGGGGKGMRRVDHPKDFAAALEGAQREGKASFGDARVLIEKYITRPRHIEMQVFGDTQDNVVHLFERDCSLQRRHQKVIEEAPAPGMPEAMRKAMGEAAVKAARAVGYVGAGTIEFIADASEGLKADRFWFMEMNTRLQVEHPVTESITGFDLVEWQLRVAAGEKLPATQKDVHIKGHAIEARLYAEDPQKGFLPSIGTLEWLKLPEGVRVDSGVRGGDTISPFYDPMIAKVIAHAGTREATLAKLADALSTAQIAGVRTNNAFLVRALRNTAFIAGDIDTGFIERNIGALVPTAIPDPEILATAARFIASESRSTINVDDPWSLSDSFRLGAPARQFVSLMVGEEKFNVDFAASAAPDSCAIRLANGEIAVMKDGDTLAIRQYDPFAAADAAGNASDRIVTPMPGKIVQVMVRPGDKLAKGQPVAVLEAMKMEHTLSAPADVQIATVDVSQGDQVNEGTIVVRFVGEKKTAA